MNVAFAILLAAAAAGDEPKLSSVLTPTMPGQWALTMTTASGGLIKFGGYASKEACEKDIAKKEHEQHATYGHCDKKPEPAN